MKGRWVPQSLRDQVVDFIDYWSNKTGLAVKKFLQWSKLSEGKYFSWKRRYGQPNSHNSHVPREHWLTEREKLLILQYYSSNSPKGIGDSATECWIRMSSQPRLPLCIES